VPFIGLIKNFQQFRLFFRKNRENCLYAQW